MGAGVGALLVGDGAGGRGDKLRATDDGRGAAPGRSRDTRRGAVSVVSAAADGE